MPRWAPPTLPSGPVQSRIPRGHALATSPLARPTEPPPAAARPAVAAAGRIGYYALLVYLFLYQSRIFELTLPQLRLPMILNLIFLAGAVFSGGLARCLRSRIFLLLAGFLVWMVISTPFSVWKGGSVETLVQAVRSIVLMAAIVALAVTVQDSLRLMYALGVAGVAAALMSLGRGTQDVTERLVLEAGSLSDPNIYCVMLYTGLPFLWLAARNTARLPRKAAYVAATVIILAVGVGTGSRSGFVALCVMLAVLLLRLPAVRKLRLVVGAGLMVVVASLVFSPYILKRYTTLFRAEASEDLTTEQIRHLGSSVASTESRLYLLRRSVELTFEHPLFGVGPGMFMVAEDLAAKAEGQRRGSWHQTHNTYTQVSAEAGLPAFLLYMAALVAAVRTLWRVRKVLTPPVSPGQERARHGVIYLEVAFFGALAAATFLSLAYVGLLYILMGLSVALERAVAEEKLKPGSSAAPQTLSPAPGLARS